MRHEELSYEYETDRGDYIEAIVALDIEQPGRAAHTLGPPDAWECASPAEVSISTVTLLGVGGDVELTERSLRWWLSVHEEAVLQEARELWPEVIP